MKTDYSYYNQISYPLPSSKSIKDCLNEKLFLAVKLKSEGINDCILILASYCQVITLEEICTYFKSSPATSVRTYVRRCVDSKYLSGVTLYPSNKTKDYYDSRSNYAYFLTKKGFEYVRKKYRPELTDKDYKKYASQKYLMHTYSAGWNFVSLLACPFVTEIKHFQMEALANFGAGNQVIKNSLCIDGYMKLQGDTLYLEQDMGTEGITELRRKLITYAHHNVYSGDDNKTIIISFKKPYVGMISSNPHKCNTEYARFSNATLKHMLNCAAGLLADPDRLLPIKEVYERLKDKTYEKSELVENLYNDLLKRGYLDSEDGYPLIDIMDDLQFHYECMENYSSKMYHYEYNTIQEEFFVKRRNSLIKELLLTRLGAGGLSDKEAYVLGMHMYACPTTMINQAIFFILLKTTGFKEILDKTFDQYFVGFDKDSFTDKITFFNEDLRRRKDSSILQMFSLCNIYTLKNDWIISVENLAFDISASARVQTAVMALDPNTKAQGTIIVCLVRNKQEALFFNEQLKLNTVSIHSHLKILFLSIAPDTFSIRDTEYEIHLPQQYNPDSHAIYYFDKNKILRLPRKK